MSEEYVILVDENDNPVGREEKTKCHLPDGKLHRAFTALLFEPDGSLVLARRAAEKMLWPGCWDGTFASHPREGETYVSSGERRMPEELGASCSLEYLHKFEYHVPYRDVGSENEICATLVGVIDSASRLEKVSGEIDGIRPAGPEELVGLIKESPEQYCPWMLVALLFLKDSDRGALGRHEGVLSAWTGQETRDALKGAIGTHMAGDMWRLADG